MGLKQLLIRGLLLIRAGGREGYGSYWIAGRACGGRGQHDVAPARGAPCVLPGKLSLDHGTLAVAGCTGSLGDGCVDNDLCLHTGFLVAAATALVFHAHLWCLR